MSSAVARVHEVPVCTCAHGTPACKAVFELARGRPPDGPAMFRRYGENDDSLALAERAARRILADYDANMRTAITDAAISTRRRAFVIARARALSVQNVYALLHATFSEHCEAHGPLTRFTRAFAEVLGMLQGSGPLAARCTVAGRTQLAGDFDLGPIRHDGRWHLNIKDKELRLMAIDIGRRLARGVGQHALERHIALAYGPSFGAPGLRDVGVVETNDGYRVSARTRAMPFVRTSILVTRSGVVDWESALGKSAQAARRPSGKRVLFDSTLDVEVAS